MCQKNAKRTDNISFIKRQRIFTEVKNVDKGGVATQWFVFNRQRVCIRILSSKEIFPMLALI